MKQPITLYSLAKLVEQARSMVADFETVTFDLFDTLLIRRIHDPDLVKLPVARFIENKVASYGIKRSWQSVQKTRDRIEQQQRHETFKKFEDLEACYPVFMENSLKEIFGEFYEDHLLKEVTNYELEMESRMLVPRELFVDLLKELRELNKRAIINSYI